MAPKCAACSHEDHDEIDRLLIEGEPYRAIARRFGMSPTSVMRHRQAHVSAALIPVVVGTAEAPSGATLDRLERVMRYVEELLLSARQEQKPTQLLAAIKEARMTLETIAKVRGEMASGGPTVQVVNIATSVEWQQVQSAMMTALGPFPDARQAVAAQLLALDAGEPS